LQLFTGLEFKGVENQKQICKDLVTRQPSRSLLVPDYSSGQPEFYQTICKKRKTLAAEIRDQGFWRVFKFQAIYEVKRVR
jgi:hypothetical protein